jgi:two-component system chemotaxis response regulator CheB
MSKIRVMIVEDSAVTRELLRHIVESDERLEVVAAVESAEEAIGMLKTAQPHVISMDIRLPGINGLEATQRIMIERPTPIVVVAASVAGDELNIGINALRAGALAVVEKPNGVTHPDFEAQASRICTQLAIMSQVKVVRQHASRVISAVTTEQKPVLKTFVPAKNEANKFRVLGIVASTGGPNAVMKVLRGLGPQFPLPILLVQHITPCFLDGFVAWLATVCPFNVAIARHGETPQPGTVYLPSADRHLRYDAGVLKMDASDPVSFQRPSGTILFESLAKSLGPQAIGVLLTGMGDDGARGLLAMKNAGSLTFAENETTAVVYGMPAEAARMGAVCYSLPLDEIAPRVVENAILATEKL